MKHKICMFGCLLAITLGGCSYNEIDFEKIETASYQEDIVPLFNDKCIMCHKDRGSAFSLETPGAYEILKQRQLVNKNNPTLLTKLKEGHPTSSSLNDNQLKKIELWIKEGALEN
ncbi:hypothetical protein K5X82_11605 [Halosquirtibacter xylanolyticus]|uniref:hypothetical protein n=1 Tax=Halosquirtibacter xylanolyticus TaxID=3374599 RepID=UPI00374A27DF|nr:hypothetical protein K5X82_11605 [Prolixibacteraceae bacterium]